MKGKELRIVKALKLPRNNSIMVEMSLYSCQWDI